MIDDARHSAVELNRNPLHHRSEADVDADAYSLFAHLDDHRRLAGHMEKPSRRGLSKLIMGSVTQKVLRYSRIPVVVYR